MGVFVGTALKAIASGGGSGVLGGLLKGKGPSDRYNQITNLVKKYPSLSRTVAGQVVDGQKSIGQVLEQVGLRPPSTSGATGGLLGTGQSGVSGGFTFGKNQFTGLVPIVLSIGAVLFFIFSFGGLFRKPRRGRR